MRSRLEATWAAFFDEMRIDWEYEPVDMDGWIPDFAIWMMSRQGSDRLTPEPMYVEVKPIWDLKGGLAQKAIADMDRNRVTGLLVGNSVQDRRLGWVRIQCTHDCDYITCDFDDSKDKYDCRHERVHTSEDCEREVRSLYAGVLPGGFDWSEEREQFTALAGAGQAQCPLRLHVAHDATADWVNRTACCDWWSDGFDGDETEVVACLKKMWARAKNRAQWRPPT